MADERKDPYAAFRFKVEIDNLVQAGFSECSGLQVETETEEVREGGVNDFVYKLPKGSKQVNLTLKHGLSDSRAFWDWHQEVVKSPKDKPLKRRTVYVIVLDNLGEERWRWQCREAYPVKWVGPELKADGNAITVETLELAHHGIDLIAPR